MFSSVGGAVSNSSEGSEYNPNRYQDSNGLNGQVNKQLSEIVSVRCMDVQLKLSLCCLTVGIGIDFVMSMCVD